MAVIGVENNFDTKRKRSGGRAFKQLTALILEIGIEIEMLGRGILKENHFPK